MDEDRRIAAADEVPTEGSLLFAVRDGHAGGHVDEIEAVLVRSDGSKRYEFVRRGPGSDGDLSSWSGIGF